MVMIFLRTIIMYIFLVVVMRLTGKRQIGELQLSELITALLLSELAASPITNNNIPLCYGIVPILTLICIEIINTFIVTKSQILKRFFDGVPSILINKGVLDQKELAKTRMSIEELTAELRLKDIYDLSEVEYAILEQNGQLSAAPKTAAKPLSVGDMSLVLPDKGIAHLLIVDGKISKYNLRLTGKTEIWLKKRIKAYGFADIDEVFLFTIDDSGGEYILRKTIK